MWLQGNASFVSIVKCHKDVKYWRGGGRKENIGERITDLFCQETLSSYIRNIHLSKKNIWRVFHLYRHTILRKICVCIFSIPQCII
jgi:hypothetical protein